MPDLVTKGNNQGNKYRIHWNVKMPLQQISVSPLDWTKDRANSNQQKPKILKLQDPVFTTSGLNPLERCPSQASTLSNNNDICRICHCESEEDAPLIAPCYCAGSLRYVHQACLQQWIKSSDIRSCELCKFQFVMQSKLKPFNKWESLEMNGVERRKLLCSVTFHAVALTCVVWSLYVLVDRTVEEIHRGLLEWPFWTKLIVVAIGFAGGVVFMYIQCKAYLHLCRRWRAFNRVIYVQNAPEKAALPPAAGIIRQDSSYASETCCGVVVVTSEGGGRPHHAAVDPVGVHGKSLVAAAVGAKGDRGVEATPEGCDLGLGDLRPRTVDTTGCDSSRQEETELDSSRELGPPEGERSRLLGGGEAEDPPSSSEDSFKSLSIQLLQQNQRSMAGSSDGASRRPWASLDSCAAAPWPEGSPAGGRRPDSSRGSRSPLLTTPAPTPPANAIDRAK